jgi:hypothetical protein
MLEQRSGGIRGTHDNSATSGDASAIYASRTNNSATTIGAAGCRLWALPAFASAFF